MSTSKADLSATIAAVRSEGNTYKAAAKLGIGQSTVVTRLKKARSLGMDVPTANRVGPPSAPATVEDKRIGGDDKDRKIISQSDEIVRLTKALKQAHRDNNTAEIIRDICSGMAEAPVQPMPQPSWLTDYRSRKAAKGKGGPQDEVPVFAWGDWHFGERVEKAEVNGFNEYNTVIATERAHRLFDKGIALARDHHSGKYPGAVINLLGDFVSGGLHPELLKTDEDEVIPGSLRVRDILVEGIRRYADEFGQLYIPVASGNHGRTTVRPEYKRYHRKNFDWLIYQLLQREFDGDERVVFDDRPSNDVHYRVYGESYLMCHGDMLGVKGGDGIIGSIGPITRGAVKQSGQSLALGMPFKRLIIGHWHQRLWLPHAIVNGALKGFDEFAMKALGATPDRATQTLWFVHPSHGVTAHWDIYVDESPAANAEWVSWKPRAA